MKPRRRYRLGEKVSDAIAQFGGSWAAIITFSIVIIIWVILNTWLLSAPVDPYPYILLNLFLSCIAALQAPFILMADMRKEKINDAKTEEILSLNKKISNDILELRRVIEKIKARGEASQATTYYLDNR